MSSLTCDQQVDAILSGTTSYCLSYVPLGYIPKGLASAVDPLVEDFLLRNGWPGGAVSVTYEGKLILARSYGYGDLSEGMYMEPDSRFRVASVSKSITAIMSSSVAALGWEDTSCQPWK